MKQSRQQESVGKLEDGRRAEIREERTGLEDAFGAMNRAQRLIALKRLEQIHDELIGDLKARHTEMTNGEREEERTAEQPGINRYMGEGGQVVTGKAGNGRREYAAPTPPKN
jgi:hypothetical protein